MVTSPFPDGIGGCLAWGEFIIVQSNDGDLVDAIGLSQPYLDIFVASAGDVLADVISANGHLAVTAVDEYGKLNGTGSPKIDESIHGGADAAAGEENIIDEYDGHIVDVRGNICALDYSLSFFGVEVIAVETEIERADGQAGVFVLFNAGGEAFG
jgi:hypothetical protein